MVFRKIHKSSGPELEGPRPLPVRDITWSGQGQLAPEGIFHREDPETREGP